MLYSHITNEPTLALKIVRETFDDFPKEICFDFFYLCYVLLELVKDGKVEITNPEKRNGQHLWFFPKETIINGIDVSGSYNFDVKRK